MTTQSSHIDATYYQVASSQAHTVQLLVSNEGIRFTIADEDFFYALDDTKLEPPLAKLPRELKLVDGSKLILDATASIDHFYETTHYLWLNNLEKHKLFYLSAFILVPLFLIFIIKFAIPSLARNVAPLLPPSALQKIDEQTLYTFDKTILNESILSDDVRDEVILHWTDITKGLQLNTHDEKNNYALLFRASKFLGPNAFALPGGTVVITDDLIELLKDKPEAIKAILLHEIGHVVHHHGMQMIAESFGITLLTTYLFGDLDGIAETFNGLSATVIQNKFSQSLEAQADDYALKGLKALNISPNALAEAFIALSKEIGSDGDSFLEKYYSSHPSIKSRIEKAKLHL